MQIVQDFQKHGGLEHVRCINTGDIIVDVWLSRMKSAKRHFSRQQNDHALFGC